MRHGPHNVLLVAAALLLAPAVSSGGGVEGTSDDDVVVYGRMFHWAVADGGGWAWRYDGEGGCVYEYDAYNSPTYRGDYDDSEHDEYSGTWYVYGGLGDDHIYTPSEYDSGSLVCYSVTIKVETDTVNQYTTHVHGDTGSASVGDNDTIFGCPSWGCYLKGNGGVDDIVGGSAGDWIYGQDGVDELRGGEGGDWIEGGNGNDWLYGDDGVDYLFGQADSDHLYGYDGDDWLVGAFWSSDDGATNYCYGGDGSDHCDSIDPYYCDYYSSCSSGGS